jgi:hypothetical protein
MINLAAGESFASRPYYLIEGGEEWFIGEKG